MRHDAQLVVEQLGDAVERVTVPVGPALDERRQGVFGRHAPQAMPARPPPTSRGPGGMSGRGPVLRLIPAEGVPFMARWIQIVGVGSRRLQLAVVVFGLVLLMPRTGQAATITFSFQGTATGISAANMDPALIGVALPFS